MTRQKTEKYQLFLTTSTLDMASISLKTLDTAADALSEYELVFSILNHL